jgi:hypothetical protein
MAVFQLGSRGAEVRRIQQKLAEKGLYRGPVDGDFGGGTRAAVVAFQESRQLSTDGTVGPDTWRALFEEDMPRPEILSRDLATRCLSLTGAFETGTGFPECFCGISGDFDGQGISFGVLQWNLGQGSLQPMLQDMLSQHASVAKSVFGDHLDVLKQALGAESSELLAFARSVQHPVTHAVFEPWRGFAKALGRTPEFQAIQTQKASSLFRKAIELCGEYDLKSERAAALMFDIVVQNGSISNTVRALIRNDYNSLPSELTETQREVRRMEIVANRRAEASHPRWVDDVRARKLCIARGIGKVHGIQYDLEEQFGIGLSAF